MPVGTKSYKSKREHDIRYDTIRHDKRQHNTQDKTKMHRNVWLLRDAKDHDVCAFCFSVCWSGLVQCNSQFQGHLGSVLCTCTQQCCLLAARRCSRVKCMSVYSNIVLRMIYGVQTTHRFASFSEENLDATLSKCNAVNTTSNVVNSVAFNPQSVLTSNFLQSYSSFRRIPHFSVDQTTLDPGWRNFEIKRQDEPRFGLKT